MKIFFATDIHGSEICWRKFLNAAAFYKADLVILGGDVTGKVMIPIVSHNGYWQVTLRGKSQRIENREALAEVEQQIRNRGSYPAVVSPDELQYLSEQEGEVDRRFSVEMDQMIESSPCVTFAEGKVLDLGTFCMVSMGWTNPTPWDTFREAPEDDLAARIEAVARHVPDMSRTIFNFHAPPLGSGLDEAPALDENMRPIHGGAVMKPVGSKAVKAALLKYEPALSVHGHIHESRGVAKLGRTLAMNPGSSYTDGVLQGAVLDRN